MGCRCFVHWVLNNATKTGNNCLWQEARGGSAGAHGRLLQDQLICHAQARLNSVGAQALRIVAGKFYPGLLCQGFITDRITLAPHKVQTRQLQDTAQDLSWQLSHADGCVYPLCCFAAGYSTTCVGAAGVTTLPAANQVSRPTHGPTDPHVCSIYMMCLRTHQHKAREHNAQPIV